MIYSYRRDKDVQKKAGIIQQYFNKISITRIGDLGTDPKIAKEIEDASHGAFSAYHTSLESMTTIDQARTQRYREYEQMCYVPELAGGLELYADDASLYNEEDRVVDDEADNQDIVDTLDNLWFRALDMNSNLWHIVYNTCKYGDAFYEIVPDSYKNPRMVKYLKYIPPEYVSRNEIDGNLISFVVRIPPSNNPNYQAGMNFAGNVDQAEEIELKPWQVVHFKLDDKQFDPYGKSVLEPGRLAFKQMKLIEDAMLIYRISRAPERRIFNIPVGQLPYREAMQRVEDFKQRYRKTPWIDPTTGEINYKANPLSINDDFFIPKRPDGTGVTIETLPGGMQLGEIDDTRYFKEKILRTMRIPIAYLTGEMTGDVARTSLSAMDVRFAKTVERIQKMIIKGLEKIAIVELAFKRFNIEDMHEFMIILTAPSKIYEMQEIEVLTQKLNVIQTATALTDEQGNLFLPREWLYKNILKFNDQEISTIKLMQQAEAAEKAEAGGAEGAEVGGGALGGFAGGGAVPGMEMGGEVGAAPGAEMGPAAGAEVGAPEAGAEAAPPAEAAGGGEAGLELASRIMKVAGQDFLVENESDIKELIRFVKEYKENDKIAKDKSKEKRKLYENSFDLLFITGELKGLIRRRKNKNNGEILKEG